MQNLVKASYLVLLVSILVSCNDGTGGEKGKTLSLDSLNADTIDSISLVNNSKDINSIPGIMQDTSRALTKGSLWDEWTKYFKVCLQSDVDSKVSYVSMANTDGPGILYDEKLGLPGKNIKNYVPGDVYEALINTSGSTPTCTLNENDYKLIGGFFKATILKLINIDPNAQGTKVDTVIFSMDRYSKSAINKGVLDSLYAARNSDPKLKSYFDDLAKKNVRMIVKGYLISGFSATIKFNRLDTAGLAAGLDTGLVKNFSGSLGFKFNKSANKVISARSTTDFIPLVQFVRKKDID